MVPLLTPLWVEFAKLAVELSLPPWREEVLLVLSKPMEGRLECLAVCGTPFLSSSLLMLRVAEVPVGCLIDCELIS